MGATKCKMAASMSAEQVLEQILDKDRSTAEESVAERLKSGVCSAHIDLATVQDC